MRHLLGVLGVLAAGVLLAVSAAMNWRFGFSLGRTELDGQIYGAASAAADCLKALIPFFFFAAIRNKMWSQAGASAIVWVVVTAYSMTSALGHAALNRFDTTGQRAQAAQVYQDLRDDLKRAEEQAGWIPQHRPYEAVQSAIDGLKTQKAWKWSEGCTKISGKTTRGLCEEYHALNAELASASEAQSANERIAQMKAKLAGMSGSTALSEADPQARVLADLAGAFIPGVSIERVQMAMTIFIAMLLEIGSGFGMYVAFSQWRIQDAHAPSAPRLRREIEDDTVAAAVAAPALNAVAVNKPRSGANDNRSIEKTAERPAIEARTTEAKVIEANAEVKAETKSAPSRLVAPETDVQRFYKESIEVQDGSSVTATQLYEDYCSWCETKSKEPLALPSFGREFADLGVKKERIAGRVRYIGISLKSDTGYEEATKTPTYQVDAA
ncbi:MAG: hypothetical protein KDJ17_06145 [Hyphomicrobiaceae bacterium]|nr:hypothetical protein [Hyphomicrobiaceae bacterium]